MSRVLIVDDEPDIAESLSVMLRQHGHQVLAASSGKDGLDLALRELPDVVLLDVMMPEMDGFQVCRKLKAARATHYIPVLMLTALNQVEDKIKGLDAGADDFVTKPFNDAELRARMNAFLRTKKLHDDLDASYKKLQELEQMRDALTGMIVHDLKAPLTAINGGLNVIMDHVSEESGVPDAVKKLIANAQSSAKRLVGLIQDILDVSRMEQAQLPLKKAETDLVALARECVRMLEPVARSSDVQLEFLGSQNVTANVDASLIERVLSNLISNSVKFTETGGKVSVGVRALGAEKSAEIFVQDTGIGIPRDHLGKIFDKFFQSEGHEVTRKGQGLGLAFCRMAIESHGGRIWAESEKGKGSRFIMRLPL